MEPRTYKQAVESPQSAEWLKAIADELNSLAKRKVYELAHLPAGKRMLGYKWVFKLKKTAEGLLERYKSRLTADGSKQLHGVDFEETFAPCWKVMLK